MTKYSNIWENGTKKVPRQSDSLDRFEQVERSKITNLVEIAWLEDPLYLNSNHVLIVVQSTYHKIKLFNLFDTT